ncbi:MAG TPA: hypothetical protein VMN36_09950 [Verrucomicrobiales bacterium]|nr:hypothetical protein [Verrucomicrobiales bacterium]
MSNLSPESGAAAGRVDPVDGTLLLDIAGISCIVSAVVRCTPS